MKYILIIAMFCACVVYAGDRERIAWQQGAWCPVGIPTWHDVVMTREARDSEIGSQLTALCDQTFDAVGGVYYTVVYILSLIDLDDVDVFVSHKLGPFALVDCLKHRQALARTKLATTVCERTGT